MLCLVRLNGAVLKNDTQQRDILPKKNMGNFFSCDELKKYILTGKVSHKPSILSFQKSLCLFIIYFMNMIPACNPSNKI